MKWRNLQDATANANAILPRIAEKYFKAGRRAVENKPSSKSLHRFRIVTKQFRYSLELFQPVYGPTLDKRLQSLRLIQEALGKVSDCQTMLEVLAGDRALEQKLARALKKRTKEFRRHWQAFDSEGQMKRWKSYLSGSPRRKPAQAATARARVAAIAE